MKQKIIVIVESNMIYTQLQKTRSIKFLECLIFTPHISDMMGVIVLTSSVCVGLLRVHYTPLQRYMGYLCTRQAQYAPPRRKMHHGAQGRLCFLKNTGDPDDFLFWWFTENTHKICTSTVYGVLVHQEGAICTTQAQYAPRCTRETMVFEKYRGP